MSAPGVDPYLLDDDGRLDADSVQRSVEALSQRLDALQETDSGWIDMPLVAPWVQYGAGGVWHASYRRRAGLVFMRGLIRNTVGFNYGTGVNLHLATLPIGFRPGTTLMGQGYLLTTVSVKLITRLDLLASGGVHLVANQDWAGMQAAAPSGANNGLATWLRIAFPPFIAEG